MIQVIGSESNWVTLARDPFGKDVPVVWVPSLWITMDRQWERFPPAIETIDLGVRSLWLIKKIDSASPFTVRRRVFGDRGLSSAVVARSTVEVDDERLFADVAEVGQPSLSLVAELMRDWQTSASTALLMSPGPILNLMPTVVLLNATWISRQSHGEPQTSQCFSSLLSIVRERATALVLPFNVPETGQTGVTVFGNNTVVEAASKRMPSVERNGSSLAEAWRNGLTIPLLGA